MNNNSFEIIKSIYKDYDKDIIGFDKIMKSSIIVPLAVVYNKVNVLFEVRSKKLKSQPGDICFPGGKIEKNELPKQAALREINEELGISKNNIEIISELDTFIRYDGLLINCFLGVVNSDTRIIINKDEVDHYFYVPLEYFINNKPTCYYNNINIDRAKNFPYNRINGGVDYKFKTGRYPTYFYQYNNYNIWGITANILYNFVNYISARDIEYNNSQNK